MISPSERLREKWLELARAKAESVLTLPAGFVWCDSATRERIDSASGSIAGRLTRIMQRWPPGEALSRALRQASTRIESEYDVVYMEVIDHAKAGFMSGSLAAMLEFIAASVDLLVDGVVIVSLGDEPSAFIVDVEPEYGSVVTTLNGPWPAALVDSMARGPAPMQVFG